MIHKYSIHKEGTKSILWTAAFSLLLGVIFWLYGFTFFLAGVWLLSFFMFLVVLSFFRLPYRERDLQPEAVLSPADGKVVYIGKVFEPEYFQDERLQISVFMSPSNVHVNLYPISGKVCYTKYHPGKYLVAWHDKSSTMNERNTVVLEGAQGRKILVRQIAGAVARRIVSYAVQNAEVQQIEELGFIKFGSRVDVFLPLDVEVTVSLEQKVKGGTDVLAKWK